MVDHRGPGMSTAAETPQLALPSGDRERVRDVLNLGVFVLGAGVVMVFGALFASYFHLRAVADDWPPGRIQLDNYNGVTLFLTALLSSVTAEWAPYAIKRNNRRQALWAMGLTVAFGICFINLLWFVGNSLGFGPGDHAYGAVVTATLITAGVNAAIGVGFVLVALLRTSGHQVNPGDHELVRAASWYWEFVVLSWTIAFVALYLFQNK